MDPMLQPCQPLLLCRVFMPPQPDLQRQYHRVPDPDHVCVCVCVYICVCCAVQDFANAFGKMLELGVKRGCPFHAAKADAGADAEVDA